MENKKNIIPYHQLQILACRSNESRRGGRGIQPEADLPQPRPPFGAVLLVVARRVLQASSPRPRVPGRRGRPAVHERLAPSPRDAGGGPRVGAGGGRDVDGRDQVVSCEKEDREGVEYKYR